MSMTQYALLILAIVLANSVFVLKKTNLIRNGWLVAAVFLIAYSLFLLLGFWLESQNHGSIYSQSWQFYWMVLIYFVTAGFPGFCWAYLWQSKN